LKQIGTFFAIYAVTAFTMRVALRRLPDRIGPRPAALLGMVALIAAMLLYLVVGAPWTLVFPGTVAGLAHALLFPAVVAGGNRTFPARHRGLATTLVLGLFDLGKLLGMPLAGGVIDGAAYAGLPPYPTMFLTMAGLLALAAVAYLLWGKAEAEGSGQRSASEKS
jgi:MFS family permease